MRSTHTFYIVLILGSFLVGCEKPAEQHTPTSNPHVPVELLFTHEGCRVFRFEDNGRNHYYARCPEGSSTSAVQDCGKNCTQDEQIPTRVER